MGESAKRFRTGMLSSFSQAVNELEIILDKDMPTKVLKILFDTLEKRTTSVIQKHKAYLSAITGPKENR